MHCMSKNINVKLYSLNYPNRLRRKGMNLPYGNFVYAYSKRHVYDIIELQNI